MSAEWVQPSEDEYQAAQRQMRAADLAWDRQRSEALARVCELVEEIVDLSATWHLSGYGGSDDLTQEVLETIARLSRPRGPKARNPISATKRVRIFARDSYRCVECGERDPESLTLDHIFPWSKGGTNDEENLRTLCRPCNSRKGTTDA